MKLKHVNWGVASRIGDTIYIHKKLKRYPKLYKDILSHEKKHSNGWNFNDFKMDFNNVEIKRNKKDYYSFFFSTPSSWIQYSPLIKVKGKWIVDINLMIIYGFLFFMFILMLVILIL